MSARTPLATWGPRAQTITTVAAMGVVGLVASRWSPAVGDTCPARLATSCDPADMRERLTLAWWAMAALGALLTGSVVWHVATRTKGARRPGASAQPLARHVLLATALTGASVSLAIPLLIVATAFGGPAFVAGLCGWWVALVFASGWLEERMSPGTGRRLMAARGVWIATAAVAMAAVTPFVVTRWDQAGIAGSYLVTMVAVSGAAGAAALWGRVCTVPCDRTARPVLISIASLAALPMLGHALVGADAAERYHAHALVHTVIDPYGPAPTNPERMALIAPSAPPAGAASGVGGIHSALTSSHDGVGVVVGNQQCRASDLSASAHGWDAATGWRAVAVQVRNMADHDCWLEARPGLTVTNDYEAIRVSVEPVMTSAAGRPVSARRVTLSPRQSASLDLGWRGTGAGSAPTQGAFLEFPDGTVSIDLDGGFFDIDDTIAVQMSPWIERPAN